MISIFSIFKNRIFDIITTITIIIGTVIGIKNLRIIANSYRFEIFKEISKKFDELKDDRKILFNKFNKPIEYNEIDEETKNKIEKIIHLLNQVVLILKNKLIEPEFIFRMYHSIIIKYFYLIKDYIKIDSDKIGVKYYIDLENLDKKAKIYHDSSYKWRKSEIKIGESGIVIYKTEIKTIKDKIKLLMKIIFKNY